MISTREVSVILSNKMQGKHENGSQMKNFSQMIPQKVRLYKEVVTKGHNENKENEC